jgi:hypothetical protein
VILPHLVFPGLFLSVVTLPKETKTSNAIVAAVGIFANKMPPMAKQLKGCILNKVQIPEQSD